MVKKKTKAEREADIAFRHEFTFCWACFKPHQDYPDYERCQNAHILGGSARRHDRRALVRLCNRCHGLNHNHQYRVAGVLLPYLELPTMLTLKLEFDPDFYDPEYLADLKIGSLPKPDKLPPWFLSERTKNGRL